MSMNWIDATRKRLGTQILAFNLSILYGPCDLLPLAAKFTTPCNHCLHFSELT